MFNHLKFSDGDEPNLCRVKNVDVSSTFIKNIIPSGSSGLTLNSFKTVYVTKIKDKQTIKQSNI